MRIRKEKSYITIERNQPQSRFMPSIFNANSHATIVAALAGNARLIVGPKPAQHPFNPALWQIYKQIHFWYIFFLIYKWLAIKETMQKDLESLLNSRPEMDFLDSFCQGLSELKSLPRQEAKLSTKTGITINKNHKK